MNYRLILLCIGFALVLAPLPSGAQSGSEGVRTIAGSGALGMQDGAALSGSFLVPDGIARGRDGTIYVSDAAGQRIRAIKDGDISTIAGSGNLGLLGMSVLGGFLDGPALSAKFNHPMGLAIDTDDALYIADSKNNMIRKLDHGFVTTVVKDLTDPMDITFDGSGNLWIADYGAGVKRWDGKTLTPVPLPNISNNVFALSFSPDADDPKLLVVTAESILEFDAKAAIAAGPAPYTGGAAKIVYSADGWTFGTPRQIVALGKHQAVYTDPVTNTVRYMRFHVPPLASQPYETALAGGSDYKGINNAGFADGRDARFYNPRGILVYGNTIVVADAGNRRIRELPLPQFRTPEYGLEGAAPYDSSHYEIALVGASNVFFDSHDDNDSICGAIERRLNESRRIAKPVRCHTHRIDGAQMPQIWDYIDNYMTFRHVDLYIITSLSAFVNVEFVSSARKMLDRTKSRLLLVWYPSSPDISDAEDLVQRETVYDSTFPDDIFYRRAPANRQANLLLSSIRNVSTYDLFGEMVAYEKGQYLPLFNAPDSHMNARGNVYVGEHIADALLRAIVPKSH